MSQKQYILFAICRDEEDKEFYKNILLSEKSESKISEYIFEWEVFSFSDLENYQKLIKMIDALGYFYGGSGGSVHYWKLSEKEKNDLPNTFLETKYKLIYF